MFSDVCVARQAVAVGCRGELELKADLRLSPSHHPQEETAKIGREDGRINKRSLKMWSSSSVFHVLPQRLTRVRTIRLLIREIFILCAGDRGAGELTSMSDLFWNRLQNHSNISWTAFWCFFTIERQEDICQLWQSQCLAWRHIFLVVYPSMFKDETPPQPGPKQFNHLLFFF